MNNGSEFSGLLRLWLDTPAEERDYERGATYVLQITRNRIMYNNLRRNPRRYASHIEYQIRKWLKRRAGEITHADVARMQEAAETVMRKYAAAQDADSKFQAGKRSDHDSLPDEIKSLYTENYAILQRMRECHLQARSASGPNAACVDSDKWAFLKELIELDKKLHENWERYDKYVPARPEAAGSVRPPRAEAAAPDESAKSLQLVRMNKGKYVKRPTEELKEKIREWYGKITEPPEKLTEELTMLGILG